MADVIDLVAASRSPQVVRHVAAVLLLAALCTAADCPPTPQDVCEAVEGPASVELGTGRTEFVALVDGDTLPYHRGPQGGTHVEGAARTTQLYFPLDPFEEPDALPLVGFHILDATDRTVELGGFEPSEHALQARGDGVGEVLGEAVFLFEDGSTLVGRAAILTVEVEDTCGNTARDERSFVIGDEAVE